MSNDDARDTGSASNSRYRHDVRISADAAAIDLVLSRGGRLYVWQTRSVGCQPMSRLETGPVPRRGRTFERAEFDPFALYLAVTGRWPHELVLEAHRGRVRALWDGSAWAVHGPVSGA